jgi:stage V sporulation protein R
MSLSPELAKLQETIEGYAQDLGLDFFETRFIMLDYKMINQVAAYDGFPTRYPHWRFGMEFERMSKSYAYGLHRIYEMVINTDPCYAYLLASNLPVDQKLVMAHVYGHGDFFKNNAWFSHTNRKMLDEMANHATRIHRYVEKHGLETVEEFLDACLSLDNLIDIHSVGIQRRRPHIATENGEDDGRNVVHKIPAQDYMDSYINPPEFLAEQQRRLEEERQQRKNFPEEPERDILLFLLEHAPLENWQRDVLDIVREEAYYFAPQRQTKIMNEGWACAVGDTLVKTDRGLLRLDHIVNHRLPLNVCDGQKLRRVYDYASLGPKETIKVATRRGFILEAARTHRVRREDGSWIRVDELSPGDNVQIAPGTGVWAKTEFPISWAPSEPITFHQTAGRAGPGVSTLTRREPRHNVRLAAEVGAGLAFYEPQIQEMDLSQPVRRKAISVPETVNEDLAELLGLLVGNGHINEVRRVLGLTSDDRRQAQRFLDLAQELFGVKGIIKKDGGRYRANIYSLELAAFLMSLGLCSDPAASQKEVPPCILQSPENVVAAFLRALFDAHGSAGHQGVILSTSSERLGRSVQEILLNFGILSRRRRQLSAGCWHVHVLGKSARRYLKLIGFRLERKQAALQKYVGNRFWDRDESWIDEIVEVTPGHQAVYDISVEQTHCYAAGGFINHNSYWHSTIMTQRILKPEELIDYADHHSGTMATSGGRLNPYKLGVELFRDIEDRWNRGAFGAEYEACDDLKARRHWNRGLGQGRDKIFEVRRVYNDIGFIDTFLTEEFAREHKLFTFAYNDYIEQYEIASRDFQEIKRRLLFQLTNFGQPIIEVVDANFENRGELYLVHQHNQIDLDVPYAEDTLANLYRLWGRPVYLESALEDRGRLLFSHGPDGGVRQRM